MPTDLYKAANLNLTFDDSQIKAGDADSSDQFDGVWGVLQRNESDFSVFPLALEALRGDLDPPFSVISLTGDTKYYTVTNPTYNRTAIKSDIEDSIASIGIDVIFFYFFLFIVTRIAIAKMFFLITSKSKKKLSKQRITWKMVRLLLKQGSKVEFRSQSQITMYTTFECCIGILICLYFNHMSADLVSYTKPRLVNTLQDLWNAPDVKVTFTEAANVGNVFRSSSKDSFEYKLYHRSIAQWESSIGKTDSNGNSLYYHMLPSAKMVDVPDIIKEYKMALLASDIPIGIMMGLECMNLNSPDDTPLKYSSLHISKESYLSENTVQVTSLAINPELQSRLITYYERFLESGFNERTLNKGAELTIESLPFGKSPPQQCLHYKAWQVINFDLIDDHFQIYLFIHLLDRKTKRVNFHISDWKVANDSYIIIF